jgi:hypothetical protein
VFLLVKKRRVALPGRGELAPAQKTRIGRFVEDFTERRAEQLAKPGYA